MKVGLLIVALLITVLVGPCIVVRDWQRNVSKLNQSDADHLALTLLAGQINSQQTNWTLIVVPRTNQ